MELFAQLLADPLSRFVLQIIVVVAVARAIGVVARRFRQPVVIAEIGAGILLGPSILGWASPQLETLLFGPAQGLLRVVSQLGLVLFMFLIGLELDLKLLRGRSRTALLVSHTSIAVPFALGAALAAHLYETYAPDGVSVTSFALFMGAAMSITAFPVLARILSERGLLRTKIGSVAIAVAAVDDLTAWCALAFVIATARTGGVQPALITSVLVVAYVFVMWRGIRPVLQRLARRVATPEAMSQDVVAVVLVLLLTSAWVTDQIGVHMLFGAFLFGVILPKDGGFARSLGEKLEDLVVVLLLPIFFAYSGLRTEIGLLDSTQHWLVCGLVIVVACLGKFAGALLPARWTGLSWREAGALGVLLNTRGLMELIVLNIGLDLGVISAEIFSMMVLMALVTTLMTTPLLDRIYPRAQLARDLLEDDEALPAPAAVNEYRVLICLSHRDAGPGLVRMGAAISGSRRLDVLYLRSIEAGAARATEEAAGQLAGRGPTDSVEDVLGPGTAQAHDLGIELKSLSFVSGEPASDIVRVADVRAANFLLLGLHKPVLSQTRLGGVVFDVLRNAPVPVGVLLQRDLGEIRRILVPHQGSPHDRSALVFAARLMTSTRAQIVVLDVARPDDSRGGLEALLRETFDSVADVVVEKVSHRSPATAVVDHSRRGFDLVVVGLGREWGLAERRFGLTEEELLRDCPTSVLVVRSGPDPSMLGLAPARIADA
jgi:Kef-type K+ transport system membrane component KefB/nucleotide-binding universal stress UspA family protein